MESHSTSIHFELNDRARLVKTALVIFGIIIIGTIAFALFGYTLPAWNAASDPMPGSQTANWHVTKDFVTTPVSSTGTPTRLGKVSNTFLTAR